MMLTPPHLRTTAFLKAGDHRVLWEWRFCGEAAREFASEGGWLERLPARRKTASTTSLLLSPQDSGTEGSRSHTADTVALRNTRYLANAWADVLKNVPVAIPHGTVFSLCFLVVLFCFYLFSLAVSNYLTQEEKREWNISSPDFQDKFTKMFSTGDPALIPLSVCLKIVRAPAQVLAAPRRVQLSAHTPEEAAGDVEDQGGVPRAPFSLAESRWLQPFAKWIRVRRT